MTRRASVLRSSLFLLGFSALLALGSACSSDARPGAAGNAGPAPSPSSGTTKADASTPTDGAAADAGPDAAEDAAPQPVCTQVALGGAGVAETSTAGDPPVPVGGTIPAGTYRLTARTLYTDAADVGATPNTDLVRRSIVVGASTIEIAEEVTDADGGAPAALTSSAKYSVIDLVLTRTDTCPAAGAVKNVLFSVVGDELWLFPATEKSEVYTKQP